MTTVALVGASGSGKSKVGRLLAARLGVDLVDVDAAIERSTGREIRDIFERDGEAAFRALEAAETVAALARPGVVSLGGGAPLTPAVAEALRGGPHVVWLRVSAEEAFARIGADPRRPLLGADPLAALRAMIETRAPVYAAVADQVIDSAGLEPPDKVELIVAALAAGR